VKQKINIALDGYSSCGKSTIAKAIAKELNYFYVDSGAMYRAIALFALQNGFIQANGKVNTEELINSLEHVLVNFKYNSDSGINEVYLNGQNVEKEIRSMQVSNHVSVISDIREVRHKLVKVQKRMAESKGVVMDGRDIGTVVMPDAELKFFLTADALVRAKRRFAELATNGIETTVEEVLNNLNQRDEYDTTRANDPLKKAADAIVVDNTHLTIEEQFQFVMKHIAKKIGLLEKVG
jgi:cytidylate kinase